MAEGVHLALAGCTLALVVRCDHRVVPDADDGHAVRRRPQVERVDERDIDAGPQQMARDGSQ